MVNQITLSHDIVAGNSVVTTRDADVRYGSVVGCNNMGSPGHSRWLFLFNPKLSA